MKYVIMSRNHLEGFQKGYHPELKGLFYEAAYTDDMQVLRHTWTPVMAYARVFESEESAWDFVKAIWGLKFSYTNFVVLSVHQEALDTSREWAEITMWGRKFHEGK